MGLKHVLTHTPPEVELSEYLPKASELFKARQAVAAEATSAAGEPSIRQAVATLTAPSTPSTDPAVWKSGMAVTTVSPLCAMRAATKAAFVTRARWDSNAPFGLPVVPDVNCICAAACGETSGKVDEFRHCDNVTARSSI